MQSQTQDGKQTDQKVHQFLQELEPRQGREEDEEEEEQLEEIGEDIIKDSNKKKAPGPEKIINAALKNLSSLKRFNARFSVVQ